MRFGRLLVIGLFLSLPASVGVADSYCVACAEGQPFRCSTGLLGGEIGRVECGIRNPNCQITFYDARVCGPENVGLPVANNLPANVVAALSTGTPVLAVAFYADGEGSEQCTGASWGRLYAPLGEWTPEIRLDTDGRPGGCRQAWAIIDPEEVLGEAVMAVQWHADGDGGQCGNPGTHQIPIHQRVPGHESELAFSEFIRIDTDGRSGGCQQAFMLAGPDAVELQVQFWADGDGQCEGTAAAPGYHSASNGRWTPQMRLDMDDRAGGCRQRLRLIRRQ